MRYHQGLLLVVAWVASEQDESYFRRWWARNRGVFTVVESPSDAHSIMEAWRELAHKYAVRTGVHDVPLVMRQLRACQYQEIGQWGGDESLAEFQFAPPQTGGLIKSSLRNHVPDFGV
ncbi:MAG: hypothetical protein WD894_09195 [Pirellulales bacterium]